jgi:hypothetical protein
MRETARPPVVRSLDQANEILVIEIDQHSSETHAAGKRHDYVPCLVERGQTALQLDIQTHQRNPHPLRKSPRQGKARKARLGWQ